MKGYVTNLEKDTRENMLFRKVLYTAKHSQLVLMALQPGEDIGMEVHELDQFIRIESGAGKAILDNVEHELSDGSCVLIPQGTYHNIINTSDTVMHLYTVYSPAEHQDGIIRETKQAAIDQPEEFDGKTTE